MAERISGYISLLSDVLWGPWTLLAVLLPGLWLTAATRGFQLRRAGDVLRGTVGSRPEGGGISPRQAVCTALAGTIGTGNVAGVATAIVAGGPGAVFWMWISAFAAMMTKYAEVALAVRFREKTPGGWRGGPMEYMVRGLGAGGLARVFALFCLLSSLGTGSATQINAMASGLHQTLGVSPRLCGAAAAALMLLVVCGGVGRIARFSGFMVPVMAALYMAGGSLVLVHNRHALAGVLRLIAEGAFSPAAAAGGAAGYTLSASLRYGVSRGIFSNEAGLGSFPMAHGSSSAVGPVEQGMWGIFEVFADTVLMCGFTALVVLSCGGLWQSGADGAVLTALAFSSALGPAGGYLVSMSMVFFAFSSIVCWAYYGLRASEYLLGGGAPVRLGYLALYAAVTVYAASADARLIWSAADLLNALMALPNLLAVVMLSGEVVRMTARWEAEHPAKKPGVAKAPRR